jgi:hypothetical protein
MPPIVPVSYLGYFQTKGNGGGPVEVFSNPKRTPPKAMNKLITMAGIAKPFNMVEFFEH